jgi:23S rRNA (uracil1939-C5)-methyltransferase
MLKIGDTLKVSVIDLDFKGQGVCRHDNYVIFVPGLITGEQATIEVTQLKKNFGEAKILEITLKSASRVTHEQTKLGSCDLLHITPKEQLKWQEKITQETFHKIMKETLNIKDIIHNEQTENYRNKTVFHVMKTPTLKLGLFSADNQSLIPVESFILADETTNNALKYLSKTTIKVDANILKHIMFRTNPNGEILITLIATESYFEGFEALLEYIKGINKVVGISLNIKDHPKHILGNTSFALFGVNEITQDLKGLTLYLDDRSFYQINPQIMLEVYDLIKTFIDSEEKVVDAYCGVGSIGFYLSDKASHVVMIDNNQQNITNALKTKFTQRLGNIDVICDQIEKHKENYEDYTLIVDPPRIGLDSKFVAKILNIKYPKVVYLSCDVKTMARDLNLLKTSYDIIEVYPIKQFYHTSSTETLAFLKLKS